MIELLFILGVKTRIAWLYDAPLSPGGFSKMPIGILYPPSAFPFPPHRYDS